MKQSATFHLVSPSPTALIGVLLMLGLFVPSTIAQTFTVTVAPKTTEHPNYNQGWPEAFVVDAVQGLTVILERGTTYTFQLQGVDAMHPFYITTSPSGAGGGVYNQGVNGNFSTGNASVTFTPGESAPDLLYYQCGTHDLMGGRIEIVGGVSTEPGGENDPAGLDPNYPNPFSPGTNIHFHLMHAGHATLTIYDVLGREVITLIDREMPAGAHHVRWSGLDTSGSPVANGVYLYRLVVGDHVESRRMTLTR